MDEEQILINLYNHLMGNIIYIIIIISGIFYLLKNKHKDWTIPSLKQFQLYRKLGSKNYFFKVFIERVRYRPFVICFYLISIMAIVPIKNILIHDYFNEILTLKEMYPKEGLIISIKEEKNTSIIYLKDNKNTYKFYYAFSLVNIKEKLLQKKVTVYLQKKIIIPFLSSKIMINEIKINNKYISNYMNTKYIEKLKLKEKNIYILIFFILLIFTNIYLVWYFNHKELPIHRLNRIKLYKKIKEEIKNGLN